MTLVRGEAATQLCRECGRPRAADETPCAYCGKTPAMDEASVAAARAHEARLQRMARPIRAMLLPIVIRRVHSSFTSGDPSAPVPSNDLAFRLWRTNPALPEAMPLLVGVAAWLGSMALVVILMFTSSFAYGALLPFAFIGAVAFPAMYIAGHVLGLKELSLAFADAAAQQLDAMDERVSVHCPQCGGHSAVVLVGGRETTPCPWCAAPLDLPQDKGGWIQAAGRILEKRYAGELDAFVASMSSKTRPGLLARGVSLPKGYEFEGFVMFGTARGLPVREYAETSSLAGKRVEHIELVAPTGLAGEALWVRSQLEESARRVAGLFRAQLPQSVNGRVDSEGWFHQTSHGLRVPPLPELAKVLSALDGKGALLLDPGGVTAWRFSSGSASGGGPQMAAFHDDLAALALALAQRASARRGRPAS